MNKMKPIGFGLILFGGVIDFFAYAMKILTDFGSRSGLATILIFGLLTSLIGLIVLFVDKGN